jgi:predicted ATPase
MRDALARHDAILRDAVTEHHGDIVKTTGDGVHAVFTSARDALDAALAAQLELQRAEWGDISELRVRMGLHTGEAELRDGDYYGQSVNRAARLMACAHGGQILVSQTTAQLLEEGLPADITLDDLGEHRLRDLARPEHAFQVMHPGLPHEFPPLRTIDAYRTNLPAQRTTFVGREGDVDSVAAALRESRLVTITGVGGVGKSRLAIQVAAEVLPRFPDGAYLCQLASITDGAEVSNALADAVGVPAGSGPAREALPWFLRNKRVLVILDNCEHLLDAVVDLVDSVLASCPLLSVMATSREALGAVGERTIALGTLAAPEAARLFVDRAGAARHDFTVDDATAPVIDDIAVRLDGIPLAIELAAARVRSLTPAQILERLDERLRLLTGGGRARGRHQTLRAALTWSTDLLEPTELAAFGRLSVFVGSFDLTAAEAVVGDDAWELLDALVDKSLLLAEDAGDGMRFRMLETVREFATEILLLMDGAASDARACHARYYLSAAEELGALTSIEEVHDARTRDLANYHAAFYWFAAEHDVDHALRLASAFDTGGLDLTSRPLWDDALEIPGALDHPLGPRVLAMAANRHIAKGGDPEQAHRRARASLDLAEELGVPVDYFQWMSVGATEMRSGHLDEARAAARRAVELADGPATTSRACVLLTAIERWSGDLVAAAAAAAEAEASARAAREPLDIAGALMIRGYVLLLEDAAGALPVLEEAVQITGEHLPAARTLGGFALGLSARAHARLGHADDAANALLQAISLTRDDGSQEEYGTVLGSVGAALLLLEQSEAAATVLAAAEQILVAEFLYLSLGVEQQQIDDRLRDRLGDDGFTDARARGAAMPEDEVNAYVGETLAGLLQESGAGGR